MIPFSEMEHHKVKEIVEKLEILGCPLLASKQDAWIKELLLQSGCHRFSLIEWLLSRLGYNTTDMFGLQVIDEEKEKRLLLEVSNLGLCQNNDAIEGKAPVNEQIQFWCSLIDLMWLEHEVATESAKPIPIIKVNDEIVEMSGNSKDSNMQATGLRNISDPVRNEVVIQEKFEEATSCINKICQSVNMKHLFQHDVQLLSPHVQTELKDLQPKIKVPSLDNFREAAEKKLVNFEKLHELLVCGFSLEKDAKFNMLSNAFESSESKEFCDTLSKVEELHCASAAFLDSAQSFSEIYSDLKPHISNTKTETNFDIGSDFHEIESLLESLSELKNSFLSMKGFISKLSQIDVNLGELLKESEAVLIDENCNRILEVMKEDI